jgi:hypothetical protein
MHQDGLPRARRDGLLEETVGEELLLYDQDSHIAHCLSPIAACVWRHCDGERDVTELAGLAGASKDLVADALDELREKELLLDAESTLMQSTVPGISRREAVGRIARVGAAVAATSLIVSATAATPAMASSVENCEPATNRTCCLCENTKYCKPDFVNANECKTWCKEAPRNSELMIFKNGSKCTGQP